MIIQKFLRWSETASAGDRARAAGLLVSAYLYSSLSAEERKAAEAAMVFILDDPSPKVRLALAEGLAGSASAPIAVVSTLARDQDEIAAHVIARSPLLSDADLVDLVADGRSALQRAVAGRATVPVAVCAAIAEVGNAAAILDMLGNDRARVTGVSLRRIGERFGHIPEVRARMLDRQNLPCEIRHNLIMQVSEALSGFSLVAAAVGEDRIHRIAQEACLSATLQLADTIDAEEMPALVEHLRMSGKLTPAFLIHSLCSGNVDFFAAAIVSLSGYGRKRVRGILVDGRNFAIRALYRAAGIAVEILEIFVDATLLWRQVLSAGGNPGERSVPQRLIGRHRAEARTNPTIAELLGMVEKLDLSMRRRQARAYAEAIASSAA